MNELNTATYCFIDSKPAVITEHICWAYRPILFFVEQGTMELNINNIQTTLTTNDIVLVDIPSLYRVTSYTGNTFQFELDFESFSVKSGIHPVKKIFCNSTVSPCTDTYNELRKKLSNLINTDKTDIPMYYAAQTEVMACLLSLFSTDTAITSMSKTQELIWESVCFIQAHFSESILVKDIARACHITETYLAYIYKENMPFSPSQLLTETRLNAAERLLLHSEETLTSIAEKTGFSSLRSFNFYFKKRHGCFPAIYRKRVFIPDSSKARSTAETDSKMSYKKIKSRNIPNVSLCQTKYRLPECAYNLLYWGPIGRINHQIYKNKLIEAQNIFHFKYIIVTGIFDSDVIKGIKVGKNYIWDYSMVDTLFDYLLDNGYIPIVSISSIPEQFSSGDSRFFYSNTNFPDDMENFLALIKDFFQHLSKKYSDCITQWKCSIWQISQRNIAQYTDNRAIEPIIDSEKLIKLLEFYSAVYKTIKNICPYIMIGSPEFDLSDFTSEKDILNILHTFCQTENCMPDFFIAHTTYAIPILAEKPFNPTGVAYYADQKNATIKASDFSSSVIQLFGDSVPCYCTNFSTCEAGNPLNDTVFASAALISYMIHGNQYFEMQGINLYPLSNSESEFHGTPSLYTKSGIAKAVFYSYKIVNHIYDNICYSDDNLCISSDGCNFSVLAFNCCEIRYRIYQEYTNSNPLFDSSKTYYQPDSNMPLSPDGRIHDLNNTGDTLHIRLCIKDLPHRDYLMTSHKINTLSGSPYDVWLKSGELDFSSEDDISYIRQASIPQMYKKTLSNLQGFLPLDFTVQPNEVYYMHFKAL